VTLRIADVSDFQETVDWAAYKASGRLGAICKVSEGVSFTASTFRQNRKGMEGLIFRGLYHFGRQANDPTADARHFCDLVDTLDPGEVPILDAEHTKDRHGNFILGPDATWCVTWARSVTQRLGAAPALYFSESYFSERLGSDDRLSTAFRFFWVAAYRKKRRPTIPGTRLWQSTDGTIGNVSVVPGIPATHALPAERCDDSEFEGSQMELADLAGGSVRRIDGEPHPNTHKEDDGMRLIGVGNRGIFLIGSTIDPATRKATARLVDSPDRVTELVKSGVVSDFNPKDNLSEGSFDQFFTVV
jgi:hypothetical protein